MARLSIFLITVVLIVGMAGCGPLPIEIHDWYDLDAVRDNLSGSYILMNDLDSSTLGYNELASPTANEGKGWQPIGSWDIGFTGTFDGQGYEIRDLFINRPDEDDVGLFAGVEQSGVIKNIGVVNVTVIGDEYVGGLVGYSYGTVSNSYSTGSVTGDGTVGGLVGSNHGIVSNSHSSGRVISDDGAVGGLVGRNADPATVNNSYSIASVTGERSVGGLVGTNDGIVSNSYATGSVTGSISVGGLLGNNGGTVSNSYSTGNVSGDGYVGGLVGWNSDTVANSYYNYDEVLINGENIITIGALFGEDFEEWLANDKFLDINDRLSQESGYYVVNNVTDFKDLLAFGQDSSLKFRLKNDLNLATEPDFYIPYLAGEFDGNGHKISNLSFDFDFVYNVVGLFGYLAPGGKVTQVGVENLNNTGDSFVGGLVGRNRQGTVSDCYATGNVTGNYEYVGGLVGDNYYGTVSDSYAIVNVTGYELVGGLVGWNAAGIVSDSYATGSVNGTIQVGGLVGRNGGTVSNSYSTGSVSGNEGVGGLVGKNNYGTVSNSYSTGSVTGNELVGGLAGENRGTVSNSFWDTETSGQATSAGGTGKTTAEMQDIATFSGAGWNIIAVANHGERNPEDIWNIVDKQTYPFLNWEL